MRIKTSDYELEFLPEEFRHFKIDSAEKLSDFIEKIKRKKVIGFKRQNDKKT